MLASLAGCSSDESATDQQTVVVYTSLDQEFSEPILKLFEQRTGIRVLPVYDAESTKTVGLVQKLILRKDRPECDVFWNNEVIQTQRLADLGMLAEYRSPRSEQFPERFRDPADRWTGFAARGRVILYNTRLVALDRVPRGLADFLDPNWRGQVAIVKPFAGTTMTHMAILRERWGDERLAAFLAGLKANGVTLELGNATVRDRVAAGERAFGLTDTDDAHGAILDGKPVAIVVPDAEEGGVMIPNTVALIAGAPHPQNGRKLIDFLLSAEVEKMLAASRSAQIPLAADVDANAPAGLDRPMAYDVAKVAARLADLTDFLTQCGMRQ